jgi:hypothetical protein
VSVTDIHSPRNTSKLIPSTHVIRHACTKLIGRRVRAPSRVGRGAGRMRAHERVNTTASFTTNDLLRSRADCWGSK